MVGGGNLKILCHIFFFVSRGINLYPRVEESRERHCWAHGNFSEWAKRVPQTHSIAQSHKKKSVLLSSANMQGSAGNPAVFLSVGTVRHSLRGSCWQYFGDLQGGHLGY